MKTKHKTHLWFIQWVIFIIIFLLLYVFIEPFFLKIPKRIIEINRIEEIISQSEKFDILFIGTSHMGRAINPTWMDAILPINSACLNISGADINSIYLLLNKAISNGQKPDVLIIDSFALNRSADLPYLNFPTSSVLRNIKLILKKQDSEEHLEILFPLLKTHANWKDYEAMKMSIENYVNYYILNIAANKELIEIQEKDVVEFSMKNTISSEKIYDQSIDLDDKLLTEFQLEQLEELLFFCQLEEIEVIIIDIPTLNGSRISEKQLETIFSLYDVKFLPYDEQFREIFDYRYLFHAEGGTNSHLNENGARLFTSYLSKDLENLLKIETNEERIFQITSPILTSFKTSVYNDKIVLTFEKYQSVSQISFCYTIFDQNSQKITTEKCISENEIILDKDFMDNNNFLSLDVIAILTQEKQTILIPLE